MSESVENNVNNSKNEQSESSSNVVSKKSSQDITKATRNDSDDYLFHNSTQNQEKIRDFIILKEIGQGSFGSVFLCQKENTKKKYAIKVINKDFLSRTERTEEALVERLVLSKCRHPSIVRLSLSFQSKHKLFFVMEYCPNKDLDELIHKLGTLDNDLALQIIAELVNVIDYLHNDMEISHNDLKPSNILLDEHYHIKLIDFSTSKVKDKVFDKKKGDFVYSDESVSKDIIGTAEFVSPEMVNQNISDYRTNDIWSLGVIIYIIYNGVSPFKGKNDFVTLDKVKDCKFEYVKKDLPEDVIDLLNNILIEDTKKRFNIKQIKEHKYFKDINWETLLSNDVPINLEKLEELNKLSVEKNNNENFWEQFCNDINNNNNSESNLMESENEFEIEKLVDYPPKIDKDFFKNLIEQKKNEIKFNDILVGVVKKSGFIEREVKFKLIITDKKVEILDLDDELIKKYELSKKTKLKLESENECFYIDGDKFKSTIKEVEKWYNSLKMILNSL